MSRARTSPAGRLGGKRRCRGSTGRAVPGRSGAQASVNIWPAGTVGGMAKRLPKPPEELDDTKLLFLGYFDQYRSIIADKLDGLSETELRRSRLPSGWTPIELLKHLVFMERRWF